MVEKTCHLKLNMSFKIEEESVYLKYAEICLE